MKKMLLSFMLAFCVATGLSGTNIYAEENDLNPDGTNLVEGYEGYEDIVQSEELFQDLINFSNSEGRRPVVGLDDGRTYNISFWENTDKALTVSEDITSHYGIDVNIVDIDTFVGSSSQEWIFTRQPHWEEGLYWVIPQSLPNTVLNVMPSNGGRVFVTPHRPFVFPVIMVAMNSNGYYEIARADHSIPNLLYGYIGIWRGLSNSNPSVSVSTNHNLEERQWVISPSEAPQSFVRVYLEVGQEMQLSIPNDVNNNLDTRWISSETHVATVDNNGRVTAVSEGSAYIWAITEEQREYIPIIVVE